MKPSVLVALLVGLVLGFVFGKAATGPSSDSPTAAAAAPSAARPSARPTNTAVLKVPVDGAPVRGPADALVTLVEFSDYQCPFCSRAHVTVQQLEKQYAGKLRVVMKQNPLSFHPRARPAALAALAAGQQGKYWEYHDTLFANQRNIEDADLEKYAGQVGLDVARWKRDMQDPKLAEVISHDQAQAQKLGASGTPAFFINGRFLSGAQPIDNFKAVIDEELTKAEALVKAGTPRANVYAATMDKAQDAPSAAPAQEAQAPAPAVRKVTFPADAPVRGPKAAKVTIVEWSDFECPFCGRVTPTLKQIEETYGKDVRVVFRHQPLPFHQSAKLAAEASMAAHEQGKFWEMHDKMFSNQRALDRASLERYAQEIGLNLPKFKAALDSGKFRSRVEQDARDGAAVGANGTPTFYVNGREVVGAVPFANFKQIIDEEIAKADKLLASGTKLEDVYEKLMAQAAAAPAPSAAPEAPAAPAAVQKVELGNAPVKGAKNAPVTIVAFSDFECPFCGRVIPTLKQIEDTYKGKVKLAFKNQPLPFHPNAKPAAMAAMAANEQGKFWEMHDKLFANQRALDRASLERYAQEIGLNMPKFKAAMDSNKFEAQINADSQQGMSLGANGTPTFFINGRQVVGALPFDSFKAVIDEELSKAGPVARDQK
ncbi:thioredoxin [Aggregicoccus sp. 17bor-14]|uniref:DsbA family protein n=1 Tax=Myxococcaceae TaxID=31 RepID=UPI00129D03BF|nr:MULTISPECIES: thioredoxin domain-containing protein [Myxococcaceae]MBF5041118.1 thioredoxin domain-containing protein [Simulacricoccus sp. 17bor-14]MRI86905.1 thioredoxin [Aggregicoccus sp. 17bor-14]